MPLRFHWSLSGVGKNFQGAKARGATEGLAEQPLLIEFAQKAEAIGIESLLMAFGFHRPDPMLLSMPLAAATERIKFLVACRPGICSPTFFVQQVNTVSALTGGRIALNFVAGHTPKELGYYGDFLPHDERYQRANEFLAIARALWERNAPVDFEGRYYKIVEAILTTPFVSTERSLPELYLGGSSAQAEELAIQHADCLFLIPDAPEVMEPKVRRLIENGTEVALLVSIIARPTHEEAVHAAYSMIETVGDQAKAVHRRFKQNSDSVIFRQAYDRAKEENSDWLTPYLWSGAVPYMGAPAMALVGSPEEITQGLLEFKKIGVSQFLFMGWPDLDAMTYFGDAVLPLIRQHEAEHSYA